MAILIEFVDLIIPVATIERCTAVGGLAGFLREEAEWVGRMVWWDEHLCRAGGAMGSAGIPAMIAKWESRGLRAYSGVGKDQLFCDFCIVDAWQGPIRPCSWLSFEKAIAWHKDFPSGNALVGPAGWFRGGVKVSPASGEDKK
jgi:hypothetical protein